MIQKGKIRNEVIYDMPESRYYELPYMSATILKTASSDGLAKVKEYLDGQGPSSKALRTGWLCHMRVNSPSDWARVKYPPASLCEGITTQAGKPAARPKTTAEYEKRLVEWELQHPDAIRVSEEEYLETERIVDALLQSTCYKQPTATEVVILFDFMGEQAKCRIDAELEISKNYFDIYDWKFVAGTRNFNSKVFDFRWHMQMAFYRAAYEAVGRSVRECRLAGIDKETCSPAYTVCGPVEEESLQLGLRECQFWLARIREARRTDYWPGVEQPDAWRRPGHYKSPCLPVGSDVDPEPEWTP